MKLSKCLRILFMIGLFILSIPTNSVSNATSGFDQFSNPDFIQEDSLYSTDPFVKRSGLQVLSSSNQDNSFEITLPWEDLNLSQVTENGKNYTQVSLDGWSNTVRPGAPSVPYLTEQIGVPLDAEVTLKVIPGKSHTYELQAPVLPAQSQRNQGDPVQTDALSPSLPQMVYEIEENPVVYAGSEPYPGELGIIANDGMLRQQRVVGINLYPVQYDPQVMALTVYESLLVEVEFVGSLFIRTGEKISDSEVYEALYAQELVNYESAQAWRLPDADLISFQYEEISETRELPWAPPEPGWRILVQADGFYQLTYAELVAAGWPVSLAPDTIQLFNLGKEVAIQVNPGVNGLFDEAGDNILFFGEDIDSKYTADNVYWLTYGAQTGLRMTARDGTPGSGATPSHYLANRHFEQNKYYSSKTPGDEALERWMWDYINYTRTWQESFTIVDPKLAETATLKIAMVGGSESPFNPDHHARIFLNNIQIGDVTWDNRTWQILQMPNIQDKLIVGENLLRVECIDDLEVAADTIYIDWFELDFANGFIAELNELVVPFPELAFDYGDPGTWKFEIEGFESGHVAAVYDITTPAAPEIITGVSMVSSGLGTAAQFEDTITTPKDYWVTLSTAFRQVKRLEQNTASNLRSIENTAEHLIITPSEFISQAVQLRDHRISQGLVSMSIDVQDIYDEFGYGIVSAEAIHDFLLFTYSNWGTTAPSYVVLMGDGHYNPKDYYPGVQGFGRESYIPPYLSPVDPLILETAADNRYVMLVGEDNLPDMMLGRLAVNSQAEASAFVNKIIAYEQEPAADWQEQVLSVADDGIFTQHAQDLLDCCLPNPYQVQKVYLNETHATVSAARTAILAGINAGKLIVNYTGHAGTTIWDGGLFYNSDANGLTNVDKYPVIVSMACYDGFYHYPFISTSNDAIAEVVTRVGGKGAVASWSSTGNGDLAGHDLLNEGFFDAVFKFGVVSLGEATAVGKLVLWSTGGFLDLLDTHLLFGDPATQIIRAPLAVDDTYEIDEDTSLMISASEGVLRNDTGLQRDNPLTAVLTEATAHGEIALAPDGSFVYAPDPDWYGLDSFSYQAYDSTTLIGTANVTIRVYPVNEIPIAYDGQIYTGVNQDVEIRLEAYDPDSYPLSWSIVSGPANGSLVYLEADLPDLKYAPNTGWFGTDSFTFKVNDGNHDSNVATITITVSDVPLAVADAYDTIINALLSIPYDDGVLDNDITIDEAILTAELVNNPGHGELTFNSDGSFSYEPDLDWVGIDNFSYRLYGDGIPYNTAIVSITVSGAVDDEYQIDQDVLLRVNTTNGLLSNDIYDPSIGHFVEIRTPVEHGSLDLNYDGSFTYMPDAGWSGIDVFEYALIREETFIDVGAVTIIVGDNNPPVVSDIPDQTIDEGSTFTNINLDNYVTDVDDTNDEMTWTYSGNTDLIVSIDANRFAIITIPNENWTGSETITFRATDPGGLWDEDAATFSVTAVNDAPIVTDIPDQTIDEGSTFTNINLDNYVTDVDDTNDEMTWTYSGNTDLIVSIDANRFAIITIPNENWTGSETITFRATDPGGLWDEDAATFKVTAAGNYYIYLPLILK